MTSRPITEDDLNGFVDQHLDPRRHAEVSAYLDAHPEVAARIRGFATQRDMLRAVLHPITEEPIPPELNLDHIAASRRRPYRSRWWTAAAAIILIGLGGAGGWMLRGVSDVPLQGIASLAREAADNYAVYGPDRIRPVELRATETDELVSWVSERLGRPVSVPNLEASGYRFMGGRIVATPHGPAALFMYDNDHATRLVMLTRLMSVDRETPMQPSSRDGISGFTWATNGVGYSLVGAADPQNLHPIADEVRRQMAGNT